MATNDNVQHPEARWVPNVFQLSLQMSEKSMRSESPFFILISMKSGFSIPNSSCFTTTNVTPDSVVVKILVKTSDLLNNHIAFSTSSPLEKVSITCSKLNMANSLKCKIVAAVQGTDVVFSITAPSESAEKKLINQYFSLFDEKED